MLKQNSLGSPKTYTRTTKPAETKVLFGVVVSFFDLDTMFKAKTCSAKMGLK